MLKKLGRYRQYYSLILLHLGLFSLRLPNPASFLLSPGGQGTDFAQSRLWLKCLLNKSIRKLIKGGLRGWISQNPRTSVGQIPDGKCSGDIMLHVLVLRFLSKDSLYLLPWHLAGFLFSAQHAPCRVLAFSWIESQGNTISKNMLYGFSKI